MKSLIRAGAEELKAIPLLCVLLFQLHCGARPWSLESRRTLDDSVAQLDSLTAFRIARSAARYGHHGLAHSILVRLQDEVSTEHLHFGLRALADFTLAESHLTGSSPDPNYF